MEALSPNRYITAGIAQGLDSDLLYRAAAARSTITAHGSVPVLTLADLSGKAGVPYWYLRDVVERTRDEYESIIRTKQNGTTRILSAPRPYLMQVQRWILHSILPGTTQHDNSFAYRTGRSIVGCAERHVGARWLIKMDLHNFFGEINERRVYRVFRTLGYPALLSFELARLCTRLPRSAESGWTENRGVPAYGRSASGVLPQGAPTSGALANSIATKLDLSLTQIADASRFQYTRYSDDLTFSTLQPMSRKDGVYLIRQVSDAVYAAGFKVHKKKTKLVPPGARKIVLGLLVNDESVRLLPEFRRQLLNHIRGVTRYGLTSHATHRKFESSLSMINYIDGALAFAKNVDEDWAMLANSKWTAALTKDGFLS